MPVTCSVAGTGIIALVPSPFSKRGRRGENLEHRAGTVADEENGCGWTVSPALRRKP